MAQKLYGTLVGNTVVLSDASSGVPIELTDAPSMSDGYTAGYRWELSGGAIRQVWFAEPAAGSVDAAVIALAEMQAKSLTDEQALAVKALYPRWWDLTGYKSGDRVTYSGRLYRCLKDHQSQADWTPDKAASLWAEVLPGQSGEVGEWVQPDSTNPYKKGDRVTHGGDTWVSLVDGNVWEPGAAGVTQWEKVA